MEVVVEGVVVAVVAARHLIGRAHARLLLQFHPHRVVLRREARFHLGQFRLELRLLLRDLLVDLELHHRTCSGRSGR